MKASHIVGALRIIRSQSPFFRVMPREGGCGDGYIENEPDWNPPEAGLAWAIYERAAMDHYVTGCGGKPNGRTTQLREDTARVTATTGMVGVPGGRKVNILESLGIEPEWACGKLQIVANIQEAA